MNKEIKNDFPDSWPEWGKKIMRDLEASEKINAGFFPANIPAWVLRIWFELTKLMFPKAKPDDYKESGIRFVGAVLGHQEAILKDDSGSEKQLEKIEQGIDWFNEELRRKLNKKAYRKLMAKSKKYEPVIKKTLEQIEKLLIRKEKAIKSAVRLANEQAFREKIDFFDAYLRASKTKIYDEEGRPQYEKLSSTTTIYVLMVIFWQFIVKEIRSVPALHEWLCRIIGRPQAGDLDRIKGICRRFGIVLAHRGRPRKKR